MSSLSLRDIIISWVKDQRCITMSRAFQANHPNVYIWIITKALNIVCPKRWLSNRFCLALYNTCKRYHLMVLVEINFCTILIVAMRQCHELFIYLSHCVRSWSYVFDSGTTTTYRVGLIKHKGLQQIRYT